MTDDIRKLLGGYATGTLTEAERRSLYEAALEDQALFEALADEEALRELLSDSSARGELLRATETGHFSVTGVFREWFDRPKAKVLVGIGAVLLLTIGIRAIIEQRSPDFGESRTVAQVGTPDARESRRAVGEPAAAVPADSQPKLSTEQAKTARTADSLAADREKSKAAAQRVRGDEASRAENTVRSEERAAPAVSAAASTVKPEPTPEQKAAADRVRGGVVGGIIGGVPPTSPIPNAPRRTAAGAQSDAVVGRTSVEAPRDPMLTTYRQTEMPALTNTQLAKETTAPDKTTRIASVGDLEMKYTVLLRGDSRDDMPVPPDYRFALHDRVRLRVETNRPGTLVVTGPDRNPVYVRNVRSGQPVTVPAEFEIDQALSHRIDISFLPLPENTAMAFADTREERKAEADAAQRAKPLNRSSASEVALDAATVRPPGMTVQLNLRRKP